MLVSELFDAIWLADIPDHKINRVNDLLHWK